MSSAVLSSAICEPLPLRPSLAPGSAAASSRIVELPRGVVPGSQLEARPAPATVPSGIAELDSLTGGLPRGALSEIFGPVSSGRTSLILAALAAATRRQEVCALVDAGDSLHPESAVSAGVELGRLLWIRCGENPTERQGKEIDDLEMDDCPLKNQKTISSPRMDAEEGGGNRQSSIFHRPSPWDHRLSQVLKTTDLLLQSGGFGMVVVDLADVPPRWARRIPLASWFRFRRAVENTPTVLLVVEREPYAKTCASLVLRMETSAAGQEHSAGANQPAFSRQQPAFSRQQPAGRAPGVVREDSTFSMVQREHAKNHLPAHAQILRRLPVKAELVHARLPRKPARSVSAQFDTRAAWAKPAAG